MPVQSSLAQFKRSVPVISLGDPGKDFFMRGCDLHKAATKILDLGPSYDIVLNSVSSIYLSATMIPCI